MNFVFRSYLFLVCFAVSFASAQNAPVCSIGIEFGYGSEIVVPVTATGFTNIGSCNQQFIYDPNLLSALSISQGPSLPGILSSNLSNPGIITIGWFTWPGVNLPDNTIIFNITFQKIANGTSAVSWNINYPERNWGDANGALLNDIPPENYYFDGAVTFLAYDAPVTTISNYAACPSTLLELPVTVYDFNNIGAFTLTMNYNSAALNYLSYTNNSGFPALNIHQPSLGTITASGLSDGEFGVSLSNGAALFTLLFSVNGGTSVFSWFDNGASCEYKGPAPSYLVLNDVPQSAFYADGLFETMELPGIAGIITGPEGGNVCRLQEDVAFTIAPIPNAINYNWVIPAGAAIMAGAGTNQIFVFFGAGATNGNISVTGQNECGSGISSPPFPVFINELPEILLQPTTPDTVNAGAGIATFTVEATGTALTYQWQEFITSWEDLSDGGVYNGTRTPTLTITNPPAGMNGYRYRCVVAGFCEPPAITDGIAQLNVRIVIGLDFVASTTQSEGLYLIAKPNPLLNQLSFLCHVPKHGDLNLEIINISGTAVASLKKYAVLPGSININLPVEGISSGLYLVNIKLLTGNEIQSFTIKMIISK